MKSILKFRIIGFAALVALFLLSSCGKDATCTDGIKNGNETGVDCGGECLPCFKLGDTDQAGGVIIYDKGAYTDGWRYIELASLDDPNNTCFGGETFNTSLSTDNNIGTGKANTQKLKDATSGPYNFVSTYVLNGKSDWFIPSKDELKKVYENRNLVSNLVVQQGECKSYWSSTLERLPDGRWLAPVLNMVTGEFSFTNPGQRVRFIRYF